MLKRKENFKCYEYKTCKTQASALQLQKIVLKIYLPEFLSKLVEKNFFIRGISISRQNMAWRINNWNPQAKGKFQAFDIN